MISKAYRIGFNSRLSSLTKEAKYSFEMTPEERKAADKAKADYDAKVMSKLPKRIEYKHPKTFGEFLVQSGKHLGRTAVSTGRGLLSAGGVAATRAGQKAVELATWLPSLGDKLIFGKMLGVDEGRGLFGRYLSQLDRNFDSLVHRQRRWSEDYDYANRVDNRLNRFLQGTAADALGGFIGYGGIGGLAAGAGKKLSGKVLSTLFGGMGAAGAITDGQERQLRDREAKIRAMRYSGNPMFQRISTYMDPTSTAYNQKNAPTKEEYQKYNMPSYGLPGMWSRKVKIPRSWRYYAEGDPDGEYSAGDPVQFIPYGT